MVKKTEQKAEQKTDKRYDKSRQKKQAPRNAHKGEPKAESRNDARNGKKSAQKTECVFGLHAVQALLKTSPKRVLELHLLTGRSDQRLQEVVAAAEQFRIGIIAATRQQLDDMAGVGDSRADADHEGNHQGVIARCRPAEAQDETYLFKLLEGLAAKGEDPFLLVLDGVTDPHNLGACIRTAEAAGCHAVISPKDNSVGLNPTVRKVACGAAEVLPFIGVTNLSRTLKKLQDAGIWTTGTAGEADKSVYEADMKGPMALIMGAEGQGMRRLTREHCDHLINIPMGGTVSSLNVSVATGVCLFEAVRQRSSV